MNKSEPTEETHISGETNDRKVDIDAKSRCNTSVNIQLQPGASLDVVITQLNKEGKAVSLERKKFFNPLEPGEEETSAQTPQVEEKKQRVKIKISWQVWLIAPALVVYMVTRFIGLDSYPIYFFTDEAVQTVTASDLVQNGFRDSEDELLPTYFKNGGQYNLGTSVYLPILPWLIFGKSIWVTRGTSVLVSLLAALAIGLILKNNFKSKYAFAGILFLSITPAWFLHSRTAFETVTAVTFYAAFLYAYLQYLQGKPNYLPAAVVLGVLCFYSYSPAQLVMAVTALLLLIIDFRTHLRNWKIVLISLGIAALLAVPYIRFMVLHPDENRRHLEILNSYWIQDLSIGKKLGIYFKEYLKMLNPMYWFIPNSIDLERHLMKGYGNLLLWTSPFYLLGLGVSIKKITRPEYRILLIATLAAPTGAALAGAAITRSLFMVIPAALLTAVGLDQVFAWTEGIKIPRLIFPLFVFIGLTSVNAIMLSDALINGPLWYSDYSLSGQQYGGKQVFSEINKMIEEDPERKIFLSSSWANGTDVVARFFIDDTKSFEMGSIDNYLYKKAEIEPDQVFILIPEEMDRAEASGKFKPAELLKTIDYPNGSPGFYFLHLKYVDNIDEIFTEEEAARTTLIETTLFDPQGRQLTVSYSQLDMGTIENLFDGDDTSFIRTFESNPLRVEIKPLENLELNQVTIHVGGTACIIDLNIDPTDGSEPINLEKGIEESNDFRDVTFELERSVETNNISISILNEHDIEFAHVHAWEITLQ